MAVTVTVEPFASSAQCFWSFSVFPSVSSLLGTRDDTCFRLSSIVTSHICLGPAFHIKLMVARRLKLDQAAAARKTYR